jgi:Ca2+-binding EF-hand superfamily protein
MKEGNPGRTFYFIVQGEVEICQKTSFEDPLTTPPTYLGTVINRFEAGDYFGERALITGEPRAASIRASRQTQCLAFDRDDFPSDCVLSGQSTFSWEASSSKDEDLSQMNERYGVALNDMTALNDQQYQQAMQASQTRGSVNRPQIIDGVDNDRDVVPLEQAYLDGEIAASSSSGSIDDPSSLSSKKLNIGADPQIIVPLLLRFKLIRLVTRCFDYIVENRLRLGDEGSQKRRMILVNLLSVGQQAEIRDAFSLLDADGDGEITLNELSRLMESIGDVRPEDELVDFITSTSSRSPSSSFQRSSNNNNQKDQNKQVITYRDFFGIMAEVEFYNLFLETFRALDHRNSGFVRAKDLDRVLCGIRDLVTGDRFSIIDVEDTDMMVDYEQFSKMLLGGSLSS